MKPYEEYNLLVSIIGLFVGGVAAYAGWAQLKSLAHSFKVSAEANTISAEANKLTVLSNVINIENAMYERRKNLSEVLRQTQVSLNNPSITHSDMEDIKKWRKEATESYLNSVDRLCATVLRGLIPDGEAQRDYRDLLKEILSTPDNNQFFQAGTPYKNIQTLHNKWNPAG